MSLHDEAWLADCPAALRPTLRAYAAGELPAPVALMRLLMEESTAAATDALLDRLVGALHAPVAPLRELRALLRRNPDAGPTVKRVIGVLAHDASVASEADGIAYWRHGFDRAVEIAGDASAALYALGNPALLAAATAELVDRLGDWGLARADRRVLDLGCGSGRLEAVLAPRVRSMVGVDISPAMLRLARQRCAVSANVHFVQVSGRDLAAVADQSCDVVLAIDSFPYLVQSGMALAERHMREIARVLGPHGELLIANFSYRGDAARDRADVGRLADGAGFRVLRNGTRPFALWDGVAFHLGKGV